MADLMVESNGEALRLDFGRSLIIRWCLLAAGLLAEGLILTVSFESPVLSANDHWWVRFAAISPALIRIGAASVGAFVVLLVPRFRATLCRRDDRLARRRDRPDLLEAAGVGRIFSGGAAAAACLPECRR